MASTRSYNDAIQHLNTLQSNAVTLATAKLISEASIPEMIDYLERIGYKVRVRLLHVGLERLMSGDTDRRLE